tara:strand:+ start:231 stop:413 length:183 start_codon:yes stop_codon:yes gene_type:complete
MHQYKYTITLNEKDSWGESGLSFEEVLSRINSHSNYGKTSFPKIVIEEYSVERSQTFEKD